MPQDQAATFETASADRLREAGLASDKRSHAVTTENQLDQRALTNASQLRLVTRRDSESSLYQRGLELDLPAHRGIRRRHDVFKKKKKKTPEPLKATLRFSNSHCRATSSHNTFSKTTVESVQAIGSHISISKGHCRATPSH